VQNIKGQVSWVHRLLFGEIIYAQWEGKKLEIKIAKNGNLALILRCLFCLNLSPHWITKIYSVGFLLYFWLFPKIKSYAYESVKSLRFNLIKMEILKYNFVIGFVLMCPCIKYEDLFFFFLHKHWMFFLSCCALNCPHFE